jgi:pilus assembly protein FimV
MQQATSGTVDEAHPESEESGLDLMQAEEDEIDVLAEADVYLAYRRFDKAEELLKEAIRTEPDRHDLVLKLLEVHAASGNKNAYVAQAEALKLSIAAGDAALWDKVLAMGKRIAPEHALFGGASTTPATETAGTSEVNDPGLDLSADLAALELDADITAELEKLGTHAGAASAAAQPAAAMTAEQESPESALLDMDFSLDDQAVPDLGGIGAGQPDQGSRAQDSQPSKVFGNASNVIDFESRTGLGPSAVDEPGDAAASQPVATMGGGGIDRDLDWLTGAGDDLGSLEDAIEAGDDFSSLISGEDEVGTKLDLAKAYIDMGDQVSARNILSEVAQEGSQDQQREANELMRQIG